MNKENISSKKRGYSSRLREEQAEQTRERILAAVAALMRAGDLEDLSFGSIAREAGVSVPTVYRYFPSRDAIFEGMQQWITRELKAPPFPGDVDGLIEGTPAILGYYDRSSDLFRTAMVTSFFRDINSAARRKRDLAVASLLEPLTGELDPRRANAIHALFRLMYGFEGFSFMRDRFGVTVEEMSEVIIWMTQLMRAELEKENAGTNGRRNGRGGANGREDAGVTKTAPTTTGTTKTATIKNATTKKKAAGKRTDGGDERTTSTKTKRTSR